jgi:hypothetical protein
MHEKHPKPPRPKMAPAKIDVFVNEIVKLIVVTIIFFTLYATSYDLIKSQPVFQQISLLVTFNMAATILSYFISYAITKKLLYSKYAARGFFAINDMPEKMYYVLLSLIINPIVSAFFIYDYLLVLNFDVTFVLSIWVAIKVFFMAMEYFMSEKINQNVIIMAILLIFLLLILFSASNIFKELLEDLI